MMEIHSQRPLFDELLVVADDGAPVATDDGIRIEAVPNAFDEAPLDARLSIATPPI